MAKYTVTGGAGFIGSHIVEELLKQGHEVVVLDDLSTGKIENLERMKAELIRGSITDSRIVNMALKGSDYVFHEAALISVPESVKNPEKAMLINVEGSRNVLEAAARNGAKKVVLASSAAIYGNSPPPLDEDSEKKPLSPYGQSKLDMEQAAAQFSKEHGLATVSLRYFNVYGPRQSTGSPYSGVISKFMDAMVSGNTVKIFGDGKQTRDFIYVKDVVKANLLAMDSPLKDGEGLNIASGRQTTLEELLSVMASIIDVEPKTENAEEREGDIRYSFADVSKSKQLLGFEAEYSLEKGLRETIKWRKSA